ncbi:MAG: succinylglutamate-semialdehyde dehydrogenase [Bdellovibrionales bacterium]|jgi:succinylglutamic semialdehyde dehydrogenase|nr:succinylglutamate-semialdehyde dehydrogenase [Bdellovibrionales bacterium]
MNPIESAVGYIGDYIDGQFIKPDRADGEFSAVSPADLSDVLARLEYRYDHVSRATEAARRAFPAWARLPEEQRFQLLRKLKDVYTAHATELAEVIARETGKPLWDATGEVRAMIGKIDITIEHSMRLVRQERFSNVLPGVDGVINHMARGVMAVLGPFNFPGHLPNGHIVPALATGNTIVFKPSELTPMTGQLMARLFEKAEFPKGVFNLVQGEGETGKRLVADENVDGILFTGSYETGLKIKQKTVEQYWKILALEMGGKNATIVWDDADLNKAIYETTIGAFMSTGQRCSCTSRVILHNSIADKFIDKFYETAKKLTIGHWKENPFMGPLINATAVEKYVRFQEIASREGAERLMRGKALDLDHKGYYVTPSICLVDRYREDSVYQKTEIFGPNVAIYRVSDFDEALKINTSTGFGLVTSVFTKQKALYEETLYRGRSGLVNWNRTTNGASSKLPFGGLGKSGNDRPAADFAVQYCTVPVASLEDPTPYDPKAAPPGLSYDPLT